MTNILAIVILSGASCVSPVEQSDALRLTIAGKTPCAVVVRAPVGNPFKAAQMPNTITAAAAKPKAVKKAVEKSKRKAISGLRSQRTWFPEAGAPDGNGQSTEGR